MEFLSNKIIKITIKAMKTFIQEFLFYQRLAALSTIIIFLFQVQPVLSQCLNAPYGLYPGTTFTPTCNSTCTFQSITTLGYAGEYSNVNVIAGNTYIFRSSIATDLITITNNTGALVITFGVSGASGITWTSNITGVVRYYTHLNAACATSTASRTRFVCCVSTIPSYNPCNIISPITCGNSVNVNFNAGTGAYNPPANTCGFATPGYEYIFSFTPTVTGAYMISQPNSFGYIDYFYKLASAGCSNTGWTCIDDITNGNIGNGNVILNLTAGIPYLILLDAESITGGSVTFSLSCAVTTPVNDLCGNAISINAPFTSTILSTLASTTDVPASTSSCGSQTNNIWYMTSGTGYIMEASTCSANTNFDTEIRVYTGSCSNLNSMVEIACNDDDGTCSFNPLHSKVQWCSQPGVTYYISLGYWTTGAVTGNFQLFLNRTTICSALPVELISFYGQAENNSSHLIWETASEINSDFFRLERSTDLNQWTEIHLETAQGWSSVNHTYNYWDNNLEKGIYYYRLSQVDFNGHEENLGIVPIEIESELIECEDLYFDLNGKQISQQQLPTGIYLKKCGETFEKVFILAN